MSAGCARCGARGAFLDVRTHDDGSVGGARLCEGCLGDLERMGWTPADYRCARLNRETVQVHNACCRGGGR